MYSVSQLSCCTSEPSDTVLRCIGSDAFILNRQTRIGLQSECCEFKSTAAKSKKKNLKKNKHAAIELSIGVWCTTGFVYVACDLAALDAEIVSYLVCHGVGIHWRVGVFHFLCVSVVGLYI